MGEGFFHALSPLPEPGMGREDEAAIPDLQLHFLTLSPLPALPKVLFLLLERGKRRDGLRIIGGLSLKSQMIPARQEMKPEMIRGWEDEEIRRQFQSSARPSGSRKGLEMILIHKENPDSGG